MAGDAAELQSAVARELGYSYGGTKPAPRWNFTAGFPDPATFPAEFLSDSMSRAVLDPQNLQYGTSQKESLTYGSSRLRETLLEREAVDLGKTASLNNVMLTEGAVHAITLAFKAFLDPGDVVAVEAPTWGVAIRLARLCRADLVSVPVDADGMVVDALSEKVAELARTGRRLKLVYTIPTFQTPTGTTLSNSRRKLLVELASRNDFLIIEDSVYASLQYGGRQADSLLSLDRNERVIRVDSFSKTVAPALRMGWASGGSKALMALASVRNDLGVSQLMGSVLAEYVSSGLYDEHLHEINSIYSRKRDTTVNALSEHCSSYLRWRVPDGGFFVWTELVDDIDPTRVMAKSREQGVICRPGEQFFGTKEDGRRFLRIAFSQVSVREIERGIRVLGQALNASRR